MAASSRQARLAVFLAVVVAGVLLVLLLREGRRAGGTLAPPTASTNAVEPAMAERLEAESALEPERVSVPSVASLAPGLAPEDRVKTLRVRVESALDGTPLEGARVHEIEPAGAEPHVAGADGSSELSVPIVSSPLALRIEKEGYFHAQALWSRIAEITVRLERAGDIRGRVLDAESFTPIAGASVSFLHSYCKGCEGDTAITGEDGSYALRGIRLGKDASFLLRAPDRPSIIVGLDLRQAEGTVERDFLLDRGLLLEGTVVDYFRDLPIPGARVSWGVDEQVCDGAGRFRGRASSDGAPVQVSVAASGFCLLNARVDASEPIRLRLVEGSHVEGFVRDETGEPVPGASVVVRDDVRARVTSTRGETSEKAPVNGLPEGLALMNEGYFVRGKTDDQGHYKTTGIVPWTRFLQVRATQTAHESSVVDLDSVGGPGESVWLDLVVTKKKAFTGATVHGRVQVNGKPVRSGGIAWSGPSAQGEGDFFGGEYCIEGVEPGHATVQVKYLDTWDLDLDTLTGVHAELDLVPGAVIRHDFDLRFRSAPISGQVLFPEGAPAPAVRVTALGAELERFTATTDAEGRFELEVLAGETPYRIDAGRADSVEALPGATDVRLVLPHSASLRYRVVDARTRKAVPEFDIAWRSAGESAFSTIEHRFDLPDLDGWLTYELPVGRIDLLVRAEEAGYRPTLVSDVLVGGAEEARVEVELEEGLSVRMRLDESCPPIPTDHVVLLLEAEAWEQVRHWATPQGRDLFPGHSLFRRTVSFDASREAVLQGFAPGRLRFKVFPDDLVIVPGEIELTSTTAAVLTIRWARAN